MHQLRVGAFFIMVDTSDALVSYVKYDRGGASKTLDYAISRNQSANETVIEIHRIDKKTNEL